MNTAKFFDSYSKNASSNAILIMEPNGTILDVNQAFTNCFGYTSREVVGKKFNFLFTKRDNEKGKPELELETVMGRGQANDGNYILNKEGKPIWCLGECLLVYGEGPDEKYIVKYIVNLQAKYHLQSFLRDAEELLESIFNSPKAIAMIILDGSMKIETVNDAFLLLFNLAEQPLPGSALSGLVHPFWHQSVIREALRKAIVTHEPIKDVEFLLESSPGEIRRLRLSSKTVDKPFGAGKKIFVLIHELTAAEALVAEV